MGKKLFRDLDEFIEGGGRETPDETENEGNIGSQDSNRPDEAQRRDNINPKSENRPTPPDRSSIDPRGKEDADSSFQNIPKSENAPEKPQHKGNIQPREFDKETGEFRESGNIESDTGRRPDEPKREKNIRSREDNRPEDADAGSSITPRTENEPGIPDRDGIIEPKDFERSGSPSNSGNIDPRPDERPEDADTEGLRGREEEAPESPDVKGNIENRSENRPADFRSGENIEAREDAPDEVDTEGNINPEDDRAPDETNTEGNIETREDEAPNSVDSEDNVRPREDAAPEDPNTEGNVRPREEERPESVEAEDNVQPREDAVPEDAEAEDNIEQRPDRRPDDPNTEDNIEAREAERPESPETQGNIGSREEERPEEPGSEGNIPTRDDNRPEDVDADNIIDAQEENRPEDAETDGNIESQDERPDDPLISGNIEGLDLKPPNAQNAGNVEAQDLRPGNVEITGNIEPLDEPPGDVQNTGNIEGQDSRPDDVETSDNIETDSSRQPEDVETEGNIEQQSENRPDDFFSSRPRGRGEDDISELNREERLEDFSQFFTIAQDQGSPFVLRRPEAGGGSSFAANLKQGNSREAPVGSVAEDVVRIGRFLGSPRGILYNARQQFLQQQNPRRRTRIYDPSSLPKTSAVGMTTRPGLGVTRHLEGGGIIGSAASALFDVPESARFEDELEDRAVQTEWGEMKGNLFWLSPVAQRSLPDVKGQEARQRVQKRLGEQSSNILPLTSSANKESLAAFGAAFALRQITGYLFTQDYDPQGGPETEDRSFSDIYHSGAPYILNVERIHNRDSFGPEGFVPPDFGEQATPIIDIAQTVKNSGAPFPFHNPNRTLSQPERVFGDGTVRTLMQNRSTSPEVFYENRVTRSDEGDRPTTPLHRGVQDNNRSRGLPNYSVRARTGDESVPQKYLDLINAEPPAIGSDVNLDAEEFGPEENRYSDLIPFKFIDVPNEGRIVFRAFLEGISDNLSPNWSQEGYSGRPEQAHRYEGYSNSLSFSFQVVPFSETEFEVMWEKLNYLKGLTTPAQYSPARGAGSFMVPPFLRLTIGDMFNDVFGYIESLTISVNDDMDWEINPDVGRLPKGIEVDVDWQVIQKRVPVARQKFYDAPFLDERSRTNATSQPPEPVDPVSRGETDEPPRDAPPDLSNVADELVGEGGSYPQFDKSAGTPDSSRTDPESRTP